MNKYRCTECKKTVLVDKDVDKYPTFCETTQSGGFMERVINGSPQEEKPKEILQEEPEDNQTRPASFYIGKNKIEIWEGTQTIRTTFPDGSQLVAAPQYTDDYITRAKAAGYETAWEFCKTHEILHTVIAFGQGHPFSRGLWRAANKIGADDRDFYEEATVLRRQNLTNKF